MKPDQARRPRPAGGAIVPSDGAASPRRDARHALSAAAARLTASDTPRLDAELLLAHALGIARERLLLDLGAADVPAGFDALVARRAAGEPLAYVTGTRAFWTIELRVGPGVLVPRPDSETLIEAAVAHVGARAPATVLDLGTGPGTLLLAALDQWPHASGVGVDTSEVALDYARRNAAALGMAERTRFVRGGWEGAGERFDLLLCNPPYVADGEPLGPGVREHEPHEALFAGPDGLDAYRALAPLLPRQLAPGGVACVEVGWRQAAAVAGLFRAAGLSVSVVRDLGGRDRCLVATMQGDGLKRVNASPIFSLSRPPQRRYEKERAPPPSPGRDEPAPPHETETRPWTGRAARVAVGGMQIAPRVRRPRLSHGGFSHKGRRA